MEDPSSSPALIPPAALQDIVYVLEPEWPHRAVPVKRRRMSARLPAPGAETCPAPLRSSSAAD